MSGVSLRRTRPEDFEDYHRWFSDERVFAFLPQKIFGPIDRECSRAYIARVSREERPELALIIERDGRAIGFASLRNFTPEPAAEAGLVIGEPELWGQGAGREAMLALIWLSSESLGLRRIFLTVDERNERALRLYRRLGFTLIETHQGRFRLALANDAAAQPNGGAHL